MSRRKRQRVLTWEEMPASERPRSLAHFPHGLSYFRQWCSLRWLVLLLTPALASTSAVILRGQGYWPAALVLVGGSVMAALLFVVLASGISSSNHGTYFCRTEPWRYRLDVAILTAGYILICTAGFFLETHAPASAAANPTPDP